MNKEINSEIIRNAAIEATNENIELKDAILKQEEKIQVLEDEVEYKNKLINQMDQNYRDLCEEFEKISLLYDKKVKELDEYVTQYKDLLKEMQIRRAKSNGIINNLEKALLKQSKKDILNMRKEEIL